MARVETLLLVAPPALTGVVARVEALRGRMGESMRQVEGLFDALLAQTMDNGR
jgi:hypothetical protein